MRVESITPALKVMFNDDSEYISFGDSIKVVDCAGRVFIGLFLYMKIGRSEQEEDSLVMDFGNEDILIKCSEIIFIEKLN